MWAVYVLTHEPSGLKYVGVTGRERPRVRWHEHWVAAYQSELDSRLYQLMRASDEADFSFEVVSTHPTRRAGYVAERALMAALRTLAPHGLNAPIPGAQCA